MSDDELREVERRYQESGTLDDETALLRIQHQVGELSLAQLELAAFLGHTPARRLLGEEAPIPWSVVIGERRQVEKGPAFVRALATGHGPDAVVRAAFAAAEAVVWEFRGEVEEDAQDPRPAEAPEGYQDAPDMVVEAVRAWLEEPSEASRRGVEQAPECVSTHTWEGEHEVLQDLYLAVFKAEQTVEALRRTALAMIGGDAEEITRCAEAVLTHAYDAVPSEKVPVGDAEDMGLGLCALVRDALLPWALGRRDLVDEASDEQEALGATQSDVELVTKLTALDLKSPLQRALVDDLRRSVLTLGQPMTPGQRAKALEMLSRR